MFLKIYEMLLKWNSPSKGCFFRRESFMDCSIILFLLYSILMAETTQKYRNALIWDCSHYQEKSPPHRKKRRVSLDGSKQLPALLTVECSMYWILSWRSSGENASLFQALPLYSWYDAPSPLTDVRSPCQLNCGPFFVNHHSLQLVSSLFTHI